jgi:hypothetical protein
MTISNPDMHPNTEICPMRVKTIVALIAAACVSTAPASMQDPGTKQSKGGSGAAKGSNDAAASSAPAPQAGPSPDKVIKLPDPPIGTGFSAGISGPSAREAAEKMLAEKGWSLGYDADKEWGVWIGVGVVPDEDLDSRLTAFEEAALGAKYEFARYLSSKIASAASSYMDKNPADRAAQKKSLEDRAATGDEDAKNKLEILNAAGEPPAPSVGPADDAGVAWRKRVENASSTVAQSAIGGLIVFQSFERAAEGKDPGEIALVMITTPKTRAVASALLGKPEQLAALGKSEGKEKVSEWAKAITPDELLYTFGAKTRVNEKGELCLVGFGHAVVEGQEREDVQIAEKMASQMADTVMRNVAGEMIVGSTTLSRLTDKVKMADGTQFSKNLSSLRERINQVAKELNVRGLSIIRTQRVQHPKLGPCVIVVKEWNVAAAMKAGELAKALDAAGGWKGGDGLGGSGGGAAASGKGKAKGSGAVKGDGKASDDNDQ